LWLAKFAYSLEKYSHSISRIVNIVGAIVLAVMMFIVAADVTLRYILNAPIKGSVELVEAAMVISTFFAVAYTASKKGHVAIDLVITRLPRKAVTVIDIVIYLISISFFSLMIWRNLIRANAALVEHQVTTVLSIPLYPLMFIIAFGFILLTLVLLSDLLTLIAKAVKK
jgi:TRAP-type C4-dicarboxylate transport system permease small subunit